MKTTDQLFCSGSGEIFERLKQLSNLNGEGYSDEELQMIADLISIWLDIAFEQYHQVKNAAKIVTLNKNSTNEAKSVSIHSREYRRAS